MKKTKKTGPKKKKLLLDKEKVRDLTSKDADATAGGNLCGGSTAYTGACVGYTVSINTTVGSGSFSVTH